MLPSLKPFQTRYIEEYIEEDMSAKQELQLVTFAHFHILQVRAASTIRSFITVTFEASLQPPTLREEKFGRSIPDLEECFSAVDCDRWEHYTKRHLQSSGENNLLAKISIFFHLHFINNFFFSRAQIAFELEATCSLWPRRSSSVGRASFKCPSLVQLYWHGFKTCRGIRVWKKSQPRHLPTTQK